MNTPNDFWNNLLNTGIRPTDDFFTRTRIRILNIAFSFVLLFICPFFGIYYAVNADSSQLLPYIGGICMISLCFYLNRNYRHLLAITLAAITAFVASIAIVLQSPYQVAAPYNMLVAGIVAYCTINAPIWRPLVSFAFIAGFLLTNYYQLSRLPFHAGEYVAVSVFVCFILVLLKLFVKEYEVYQRIISDKNLQLQLQNEQLAIQNQTIEQQAEELKALDEAKVQFFENISHEFRTPLTLLLGGIQQAMEATPTPQTRQLLQLADKHGRLLKNMIDQLLDMARLADGQVALSKAQGDVVAFLKEAMLTFEGLARQKNIDWHFEADTESLQMLFDAELLMKVCNNLLSNALRFTLPNGWVRMGVASTPHALIISVADAGVGIPPEKLPYIFDRFYQANAGNGGTGIGLALVKSLVELHGGHISAESQEGKGTTFFITLPIQHFAPESQMPEYDGAEGAEKPVLLLVEDNEDLHILLKQSLAGTYSIISAHNGQEGVDLALANVPDIIISDVMMPNKTGYELCKELKQDEKTSHIPIVLLTAKSALPDRIQGLEAMADDYLAKPFDHKELALRLHNLIAQRKLLQQRYGKTDSTMQEKLAMHPIDKAFLDKCEQLLLQHYSNAAFGAETFAEHIAISQRQLNRKIQALTGHTIIQFIQSYRLQKATDLLKYTDMPIGSIAYEVGFGSPAYFVKCFREKFNTTPKEYRDGLVA